MRSPVLHLVLFLFLSSLVNARTGESRPDGPRLSFAPLDLRVSGRVDGVLPADLDGDGRKDLLVLHSGSELFGSRLFLSIFYQWDESTFSSAADQTWEADSLALAVGLGEAGEGHAASILYLRRDGLWRHAWRDGKFVEQGERIAAHRTFFVSRKSEHLVPLPNLFSRDAEGTGWITLPGIECVVLYRQAGDGSWAPFDSVAYDLRSVITTREANEGNEETVSMRQTLTMPWVSRGSLGGRGAGDFFLLYEERMEAYGLSPEGFGERAEVLLEYDIAKGLKEEKTSFLLRPWLLDMGNDGISDLAVARQEGTGIGSYRTTLDVYLGPLAGRKGNAPSQRVTFEDAMSYFMSFEDLDGDGRMELIVPVVRLGIFDLVRILTTKTLKVTLDMYRLDEDGFYEAEPHWVHQIRADIDFKEGGGEVVGKLINADGDSDRDLAVTLEPRKLSVFLGESRSVPRFFEREPSVEIDTYSDVEIEASDLTGDGKDELIATFGTSVPGMGIVRIYLNRFQAPVTASP